MATSARPARRLVAGVALASFGFGLATAAWMAAAEDPLPVTYAAVFAPQAVDLTLAHERGVDGFVGAPNMAPGDLAKGRLLLFVDKEPAQETTDLDFAVRLHERGASPGPRLADTLHVTRLVYGIDDLLRGEDGGFNLTAQLDADGDGRLSLRELSPGADDLPTPRPPANGGTPFVIEVRFSPAAGGDGSGFGGQQLGLTFVFRLSDSLAEDLD